MASVKVIVHAAQGLPIMDSRSRLCDAYVSVKLDDEEKSSGVVQNSRNPTFKFYHKFVLSDLNTLQEDPLEIRVYDRDRILDDLIGTVFVDLNAMLQSSTTPRLDGWFPILDPFEGLHGELQVSVWVKFHAAANSFVPIVPVIPRSLFGSRRVDRTLSEARRMVVPRGIARGHSLTSELEGVVMWSASRVDPERYRIIDVFGLVDELLYKDDPERKRLTYVKATSLLEARATLLFRLSGKVRRQLTKKVLELGCNAVLGYREHFDIDDINGIVVRAVGTPCVLVQIDKNHASVRAPKVVLRRRRKRPQAGLARLDEAAAAAAADLAAAVDVAVTPLSGPAIPPTVLRSISPATLTGSFDAGTAKNSPSRAGHASGVADGQLVPPPAAVASTHHHVDPTGADGSPISVRQSDDASGDDHRGDDATDDEDDDVICDEVEEDDDDDDRGDALSVDRGRDEDDDEHMAGTNVKWNYGQEDDRRMRYLKDTTKLSRFQVIIVTVRDLPAGSLKRLAGAVSVRSVKHMIKLKSKAAVLQERDAWWAELRDELRANARAMGCNLVLGYSETVTYFEDVAVLSASGTAAVVEEQWPQLRKGPGDLVADARSRFRSRRLCRLLHVPDEQANGEYELCDECGDAAVPDTLLLSCELPSDVATASSPRHIEVRTAKERPRARMHVAQSISQVVPYLEYAIHRQLIARLRMDGLNCAFNMSVSLTINEHTIVATAVATGVALPWLPTPRAPQLVITEDARDNAVVQRVDRLWQQWQRENAHTVVPSVHDKGSRDRLDPRANDDATPDASAAEKLSAEALEALPDASAHARHHGEVALAEDAGQVDSGGVARLDSGLAGGNRRQGGPPSGSVTSSSRSSTSVDSTSTASRFEFVMQIDDAEDADLGLGLLTSCENSIDHLITTASAPPRSAHATAHGTTFVVHRMYRLPSSHAGSGRGNLTGTTTEFVTRCGLESRRALALQVHQIAARLGAPCMVAGYRNQTTLVEESESMLVKQSGVILLLAPNPAVQSVQDAYLRQLVRSVQRGRRRAQQRAKAALITPQQAGASSSMPTIPIGGGSWDLHANHSLNIAPGGQVILPPVMADGAAHKGVSRPREMLPGAAAARQRDTGAAAGGASPPRRLRGERSVNSRAELLAGPVEDTSSESNTDSDVGAGGPSGKLGRRRDLAIALAALTPFTLPVDDSSSSSSGDDGDAVDGPDAERRRSRTESGPHSPSARVAAALAGTSTGEGGMARADTQQTGSSGVGMGSGGPVLSPSTMLPTGSGLFGMGREQTSMLFGVAADGIGQSFELFDDTRSVRSTGSRQRSGEVGGSGAGAGGSGAAADLVVTPLSYVPMRPTVAHHGRLSHHFIRKCSTRKESTLGSFWNSTLFEAESVIAALARGLGGNAVTDYTVDYHELEVVDGKHALFFSVSGHAVSVGEPKALSV